MSVCAYVHRVHVYSYAALAQWMVQYFNACYNYYNDIKKCIHTCTVLCCVALLYFCNPGYTLNSCAGSDSVLLA